MIQMKQPIIAQAVHHPIGCERESTKHHTLCPPVRPWNAEETNHTYQCGYSQCENAWKLNV